jgi:hypothetical protein
MLDEDYRPRWQTPEGERLAPERPRHPERVRRFMYGLGRASAIIDGKMEDKKPYAAFAAQRDRALNPSPGRERPVLYGPRGEVL